ncbi:hypothetical protein SERLADRAFT_408008 [Serpula lacrymans var. lacrymans S7.9]|uniref:Uncharacterized protein n=1 Tax=Serpula lacrymans var. lacrymans (strain S7.9) TaxID=578457 RepID=F8NTR4_SERL9|nr:uncharacterized protein SERLADRAFT_408008 [Serpula lacrymans var. lacrymans S7.9]EGO25734.1 hypothetical protein SERLADRAFT_408008 [Serpula lacrymans var. lacrymans S7.9]
MAQLTDTRPSKGAGRTSVHRHRKGSVNRDSLRLAGLPGDLLLEIASYLHSRSDILHLGLSCVNTLAMLFRRPDIARHVQKLFIRFDHVRSPGESEVVDGYLISSAVRKAAAKLDALNTFVWDGNEGPPFDDMWFALRMSCPQLRTIGTTVGSTLPNPNSHLFDFNNLHGFSLILKNGFYINHAELPSEESLHTVRLCDMLIKRSPDLRELCIDGTSSVPTDAHALSRGRWPNLRKLIIGDVALDWHIPVSSASKRPFIAFLEAHRELRTLHISRYALNPMHLPTLHHDALPCLEHFTGSLEHLQAISPSHPSIKSVGFHEPIVIRDLAPMVVSSVLQGLPLLRSLKISFIFHSTYESGSLLRSLVSACPYLVELELTCARKPSFQLESFARSIRHLTRLRSLTLNIIRFPNEDPLSTCAVHIARAHPRLSTFTITFIPSSLSLPLPPPTPFQPLNATSSTTPHPPPNHAYIESGTYNLTADQHGLPAVLSCVERRAMIWHVGLIWGWSWSYSCPRTRRYTVDLHPGHKRRGLGELLLERSTAGEEARVLVVLVSLGSLAVWGFLTFGVASTSK